MMLLVRFACAAAVSWWVLAYPSVARADPIPISSGVMVGNTFLSAVFISELEGPGFSLSPQSIVGGFHANFGQCIPCASPAVNLGATLVPASDEGAFTAVIGGITYPLAYVHFSSGTITTPTAAPLTELGPTVVTLPFSFTAVMEGFLEHSFNRPSDVPPVFTVALAGSGRASATFFGLAEENGGRSFSIVAPGMRYEFAQPVPEPATLLLVGGAFTALAARRSLRRRKKHDRRDEPVRMPQPCDVAPGKSTW